jgi:hypothetical protein
VYSSTSLYMYMCFCMHAAPGNIRMRFETFVDAQESGITSYLEASASAAGWHHASDG